jgi:hypothetical protein
MKTILRYFAKKSHDVRIQLLLATIYGLLDLFGFGGTVAILIKARKLAAAKKPRNRVTAKTGGIQ